MSNQHKIYVNLGFGVTFCLIIEFWCASFIKMDVFN